LREKISAEAVDMAQKEGLDKAAARFKAQVVPSNMVSHNDALPGIGPSPALMDAVFAAAEKSPQTGRAAQAYVFFEVTKIEPERTPSFDEIKDKVAVSVKRQKAETVGLERAKQLAADAQGGDLAGAAKKAGAATGETARFSRAKPAERLPGDAMLAALQTPAGQLSAPIKAQQGYYVVKVLERVPPDMGGLAAERDKLQKEILGQKQSLAWESWINGARANSKVETHLPTARRG